MTEAEALVIVLRYRFVKQHLFFKFNTMVPTSAVSGSDCQKTEVFQESQVILVQCKKKKRINVYSPTLFNFINYFWEINQGFMVILTCLCQKTRI